MIRKKKLWGFILVNYENENNLFINLNKKKIFTSKEINMIKRKFIVTSSITLISRFISFHSFISTFSFFFVFVLVLFGNKLELTYIISSLIFSLPITLICLIPKWFMTYKVNDYLEVSKLTKILSMSYNPSLLGKSRKEVHEKVFNNYSEGMENLLSGLNNKKLKTNTHELMRMGIMKIAKNYNDVEIIYEKTKIKVIKENFMYLTFNQCLKLYKSIDLGLTEPSNKEFREVLKLLRAVQCYKITFKKLNVK